MIVWYCGECEFVSFCENGDENDGILFKTSENEEVVVGLWPARHGENGHAQRAAQHGQTAHRSCHGS